MLRNKLPFFQNFRFSFKSPRIYTSLNYNIQAIEMKHRRDHNISRFIFDYHSNNLGYYWEHFLGRSNNNIRDMSFKLFSKGQLVKPLEESGQKCDVSLELITRIYQLVSVSKFFIGTIVLRRDY